MRATLDGPDAPRFEIYIDGRPLDALHKALIGEVRRHVSLDGASSVTIAASGLDQNLDYRFINERVLFPGVEFELWAGYGGRLVPKGRYKVKHHDTRYEESGVPVEIEAFDRLTDFLRDDQARLIEGYQTHTDVIVQILERDYPKVGYVVQQSTQKAGDRVKKVGETDLSLLKNMAVADGFAYPRIWSQEQYEYIRDRVRARLGQDRLAALVALEGLTKIRGNNLVYLPLNSLYSFSDPITFWYNPKGHTDVSVRVFFSDADMPTAVEAYGTTTINGERKLVKVVVGYSEAGPRVQTITDDWNDQWAKDQRIREQIASGAALKLYTLGEGKRTYETGGTYKYKNVQGKTVTGKSEVSVNEVLNGDGETIRSEMDVVEFAKRWFLQRAQSFLIGEASLKNVAGSEDLDINQVHELQGAAEVHNGPFVTTTLTEQWTGDGHQVSFSFQKLIRERDLAVRGESPDFKSQEWQS